MYDLSICLRDQTEWIHPQLYSLIWRTMWGRMLLKVLFPECVWKIPNSSYSRHTLLLPQMNHSENIEAELMMLTREWIINNTIKVVDVIVRK